LIMICLSSYLSKKLNIQTVHKFQKRPSMIPEID
jgi:hypothetical protein